MQGSYQWITRVSGTNLFLTKSTSGGNKNMVQFFNQGSQAGAIVVNALTTAYNSGSDERLKTNIVDSKIGLEVLEKVKVRDFEWKLDRGKVHQGFIAQELYTVYPEAVTKPDMKEIPEYKDIDDKTGNVIWQVDYSKLTPLLVKAVQELSEKVKELEARL